MIEIRKLIHYTMEDEKSLGLHGYISKGVYSVKKELKENEVLFSVKLEDLEEPFTKHWPYIDDDITDYNKVIEQGLSLGAYDNNTLVGVIIVEEVKWNNSIHIANLLISGQYRGSGIGTSFMDMVTNVAKEKDVRIISLETQNTNVPAITFYLKNGFELDALDLSLYSNDDVSKGEVAFFMKKKI